ncbi:MAG: hypothetical protein WAM85_14805 [Terracidiphilus sp.]
MLCKSEDDVPVVLPDALLVLAVDVAALALKPRIGAAIAGTKP